MGLLGLTKAASAELVLDHLSGRWDRDADLLDGQVDQSVRKANAVHLTEVNLAPRAKVLRGREGWDLTRGGHAALGETAILTEKACWRTLREDAVVVDRELTGMRGLQVAPLKLLEHTETGATLLLSATHMPAGVQAEWARGRRAAEHRSATQQWRRAVESWRKAAKPNATAVSADWNLPLNEPWVRAWIRDAWPGLTPVPARRLPDAGTLGHRLIDWPLTAGIHDRHLEILRKTDASDHRGIRFTGTIRLRRKKAA